MFIAARENPQPPPFNDSPVSKKTKSLNIVINRIKWIFSHLQKTVTINVHHENGKDKTYKTMGNKTCLWKVLYSFYRYLKIRTRVNCSLWVEELYSVSTDLVKAR